MSRTDDAHAWWSRLRHQGLLLSPVVMIERYPSAPPPARFPLPDRLRDARTRFVSSVEGEKGRTQAAALAFVDALLENFVGHGSDRLAKQHSIPESYTTAVRIGSRSQTVKPHRVLFADDGRASPVLLVMADESAHVGRGKGRTKYAELLELLRATGHRLGLLTNGDQFRLVYAGLDFESWCEWEADRWFDDGEGTEELLGLRQLLAPEQEPNVTAGAAGLLHAVEESRKRQADLSSVLRENVRQAVELLLEEVSTSNRQNPDLFGPLVRHGERTLSDAEAHEALMQATVRLVMRLVVCLFAESRQLLPTNDPIYAQSYGVRTLYELLDSVKVEEGGVESLFNRRAAWPRLMALFRLIHGGSAHGSFPLRSYGGALFRPGDAASDDAVARALHLLEHEVEVGDATIYHVLRKLLRGPLPVLRGRSRTFVEGPVDYTDLRTEFIGLIYEGLLDYRLKRTDEATGPQVFLNIGREPVLPLARLEDMLANDKPGLKNLLTTLRKEKVTASAGDDAESGDEEAEEAEQTDEEAAEEPAAEEPAAEVESVGDDLPHAGEHLSAFEAARGWAKEAVTLAGLVGRQNRRETDAEYEGRIEAEANRLIKRVVSHGEFYLVRAGNTRKGTGTFYTRPQLAVPTTHRTLRPLCYDTAEDGTPVPKTPEEILGLKVCDPACGSASFLVAALHYLTDALYRSLCHHRKLDNPATAKKVTLPFGRRRTDTEADQLVPFPPDDPQRGHTFEDRVKALLRRHVVERSIYGVDINPLAVELARVSLWVETLDP
ncbi:MAG TPA: type IIL restriction-modification enzyme MmeI, partial [Planctomycetaceae bacterium]